MPDARVAALQFYAATGRTRVPRMLVVAVLAAAVLWVCGHASWTHGRLAAIAAGALAGAALAKFAVEGVRRLRDAGLDRRRMAWGLLALGLWMIAAFAAFFVGDPAWGQAMIRIAAWVVPVAIAVPLLWPSQGRVTGAGGFPPDRRGPRFALACIAGGALVALFLASLSIGMDATNRRGMAYVAGETR